MGSKDSNLERGLQRHSSYQLLHFPTRLETCSRTVFLAGEVRLELTRERFQKPLAYRLAYSPTWSRDLESNQDLPCFKRTRKPSTPSLVLVAASRVELEGRGYEPRCVTRHTPHQRTPSSTRSRVYCSWMVFSRGTLVEGTGLEPVWPVHQTGILTIE
jgi:hypothetical protein